MKWEVWAIRDDGKQKFLMAKTNFYNDAVFVKDAQGRINGWKLEINEAQGSRNFFKRLKGERMNNEKQIDIANRRLIYSLVTGGLEYLTALKQALDAEGSDDANNSPANTSASTNDEPQKRKRRTKAEIEAAKKVEEEKEEQDEIDVSDLASDDAPEAEEVEEDDLADFEEEKPKKEVTPEDVRAKLVEFAQKHSKEKAYSILEKFAKTRKTADVKPADLPKLMAELEKGLK